MIAIINISFSFIFVYVISSVGSTWKFPCCLLISLISFADFKFYSPCLRDCFFFFYCGFSQYSSCFIMYSFFVLSQFSSIKCSILYLKKFLKGTACQWCVLFSSFFVSPNVKGYTTVINFHLKQQQVVCRLIMNNNFSVELATVVHDVLQQDITYPQK